MSESLGWLTLATIVLADGPSNAMFCIEHTKILTIVWANTPEIFKFVYLRREMKFKFCLLSTLHLKYLQNGHSTWNWLIGYLIYDSNLTTHAHNIFCLRVRAHSPYGAFCFLSPHFYDNFNKIRLVEAKIRVTRILSIDPSEQCIELIEFGTAIVKPHFFIDSFG